MKSKFSMLAMAFCIATTSCKKNDTIPNPLVTNNRSIPDMMMSYKALVQKDVDGDFVVQSMTFNHEPISDLLSAQIGGSFFDKQGNTIPGGIVSIGSNDLSVKNGFYGLDKNLSRDEFYGKKVTFKLHTPHAKKTSANSSTNAVNINNIDISADNPDVTSTLYVPAAIYVNTTNHNPDPSNTITWNADPNNTNGVVIVAEYDPGLTLNGLVAGTFPVPIRNSISVDDNGSTTLPTSFYSSFPPSSSVILYVGRGSYTIATSNGYNYRIGAYTSNAVYVLAMPYFPVINGHKSISFNASNNNATTSGIITGTPGSIVTVTANAGGSGYFTTVFNLPSINLSNNNSNGGPHTVIAVTGQPNGSTTRATFVMPASGSVSWNGATYGNFSGAGANGGGSISVQ